MALKLFDSITDATAADEGSIGLSGSHGGLYPASVASAVGLRAVLFNDAGIGFEQAGVSGVLALERVGMAAAGLDCHSCLIGSAEDGFANGVVSVANDVARALGVVPGMTAQQATERLKTASQPEKRLTPPVETQKVAHADRGAIHLLDSASVVSPALDGEIVVTGSHGALIGGDPARALKAAAHAAVFSDAGFGKDRIGATRLPALQSKGVAAVTATHQTCRIGDAVSVFETGAVSAMNEAAEAMGARIGLSVKAFTLAALAAKRAKI